MLVELSTELREATQNPSTHLNGAVGLGGLHPGQEVLQLGGREAVLRVAAAERGEVRRYGGRRGYKIQILDRDWKIGSLFYFVVEIKLAWMPLAPPTTVFPNIFLEVQTKQK